MAEARNTHTPPHVFAGNTPGKRAGTLHGRARTPHAIVWGLRLVTRSRSHVLACCRPTVPSSRRRRD